MKDKELLDKIEQLEKRIQALEARPVYYPVYVHPTTPYQPPQLPNYPIHPIVTWGKPNALYFNGNNL